MKPQYIQCTSRPTRCAHTSTALPSVDTLSHLPTTSTSQVTRSSDFDVLFTLHSSHTHSPHSLWRHLQVSWRTCGRTRAGSSPAFLPIAHVQVHDMNTTDSVWQDSRLLRLLLSTWLESMSLVSGPVVSEWLGGSAARWSERSADACPIWRVHGGTVVLTRHDNHVRECHSSVTHHG